MLSAEVILRDLSLYKYVRVRENLINTRLQLGKVCKFVQVLQSVLITLE